MKKFTTTLALVVAMLFSLSLTAWAVDPVSYVYYTVDGTTATKHTGSCTEYTVVESSSSAVTWNAGWYVVSGDVTIANSITFNGNVNLILCDGATLTITGDEYEIGIDGYDGDVVYDLTVYGQSEGSGSMSVAGGPAIINVNYLTINGGSVEANGTSYGIGFGEDVTINGGKLTVTGEFVGFDTGAGTVTINGGELTVTSGGNAFKSEWGWYGDSGTVKINGGKLTATGNSGVVRDFSVINAIAGTGWTDAAGTEGETAIAVSTEGQDLSAYKKVQFSAAANSPYAAYDVTTDANKDKSGDALTALQVTFNGTKWYIIADNSTAVDAGTVTLLAADASFGTSTFDNNESSNAYSTSTVKGVLDALTAEGGAFAAVKDAIADTDLSDVNVTGAKLYLLSIVEASPLPENVRKFSDDGWWWLRSPGGDDYEVAAAGVDGWDGYVDDFGIDVMVDRYVRPALKLNLSKVSFDTETKTFSVAPTTSVATPTFRPADAVKSDIWYDLNGRCFQGKPTMPGVYINNGEKIIVQ